MTEDHQTRRELLRGGVAAGAAAAAAAAVTPLLSPATARAAPVGDAAVLIFALQAEQTAVAAYEFVLASGVISARSARSVRLFLSQEREHVDALTVSVERLGDSVPSAPTDMATFEGLLRELRIRRDPAKLRTEREYISFLIRVEAALATVYHFAIEELGDDKLIQTAAQMMANDAQHAALLRELSTPGNVRLAVPRAYVGGAT